MADRPARRRPPFGFWFPSWTSPTRASPRPPSPQAEPPPPSTSSQIPSLAPSPSKKSLPQPSLSPNLSKQFKKAPSSSSRSGRRESILPLTMPGERSSAQGKSQAEFTDNELRIQVSKPEVQPSKSDLEPKLKHSTETKEAEKANKEIEPKSYAQEEVTPCSQVDGKEIKPDQEKQAFRNQFLEHEDQLQKTQEEKPGKYIEEQIQKLEEKPKEDPDTTQEMTSVKIATSERQREEFESKERKAETVEKTDERSNNQISEEEKKIKEPKLSITVSDHKLEPNKQDEQADRSPKEAKITISTIPRTTFPNLGQPIMERDLKDGISKLVDKLKIGKQSKLGNEQGVNIITLAGENKGATMFIGHEVLRVQKLEKGEETIASINSNVQGINNSLLDDTNYNESNPGVHFTLSTKPVWPLRIKGKNDSSKTEKTNYSVIPPQKLTYEPNVRRRCLRGLFLEPSEDEIESQKPRRHGCRFSCDDNKK